VAEGNVAAAAGCFTYVSGERTELAHA